MLKSNSLWRLCLTHTPSSSDHHHAFIFHPEIQRRNSPPFIFCIPFLLGLFLLLIKKTLLTYFTLCLQPFTEKLGLRQCWSLFSLGAIITIFDIGQISWAFDKTSQDECHVLPEGFFLSQTLHCCNLCSLPSLSGCSWSGARPVHSKSYHSSSG